MLEKINHFYASHNYRCPLSVTKFMETVFTHLGSQCAQRRSWARLISRFSAFFLKIIILKMSGDSGKRLISVANDRSNWPRQSVKELIRSDLSKSQIVNVKPATFINFILPRQTVTVVNIYFHEERLVFHLSLNYYYSYFTENLLRSIFSYHLSLSFLLVAFAWLFLFRIKALFIFPVFFFVSIYLFKTLRCRKIKFHTWSVVLDYCFSIASYEQVDER